MFDSELSISHRRDKLDTSIEVLCVDIAYNNAFGDRCKKFFIFDPNIISDVKIGGTASSDATLHKATVISVNNLDNTLLVLYGLNPTLCVYSNNEKFIIGDKVNIVEHMCHMPGRLFQWDWLATKRQVDFRLNSIRIIGCDSCNNEVDVIYIDPYLDQVNHDARIRIKH